MPRTSFQITGELYLSPEAWDRVRRNRIWTIRARENGGSFGIIYPPNHDRFRRKMHGGYALVKWDCRKLCHQKHTIKFKINLFWLGIGLLGAGCFALGVMTGLIF